MRKAELLALAARVEAADGAYVLLDAAVACATTPGMFEDGGYVGFTGRGDMRPPQPFTASLDAAASLPPPRWTRAMISAPAYAAGRLIGDVICYLHHDASSGGGPYVRGVATGDHAEARARTAAALRAMAEEAGG